MNSYSERRENAINILRIKGGRVLISPMGVYMASSLAALTKFSHVERITLMCRLRWHIVVDVRCAHSRENLRIFTLKTFSQSRKVDW